MQNEAVDLLISLEKQQKMWEKWFLKVARKVPPAVFSVFYAKRQPLGSFYEWNKKMHKQKLSYAVFKFDVATLV